MGEITPINRFRQEIQNLVYAGTDSIRDAASLRTKVAAAADLAKRANQDEVEWMLMARDSERALGLMLVAGREAGDIASAGVNQHTGEVLATTEDLGIQKDLAADCSLFARLSDEDWMLTLSTAQMEGQPSHAHVVRQAKANLARIAEAERREADVEFQQKALQEEQSRIAAELAALRSNPVEFIPLREEEVRMGGVEMELRALVPEPSTAGVRDESPDARAQKALLDQMKALRQRLDTVRPTLTNDAYRVLNLYSARQIVGLLSAELAEWIREYNQLLDDQKRGVA